MFAKGVKMFKKITSAKSLSNYLFNYYFSAIICVYCSLVSLIALIKLTPLIEW